LVKKEVFRTLWAPEGGVNQPGFDQLKPIEELLNLDTGTYVYRGLVWTLSL
jgi:hypothetical protein